MEIIPKKGTFLLYLDPFQFQKNAKSKKNKYFIVKNQNPPFKKYIQKLVFVWLI